MKCIVVLLALIAAPCYGQIKVSDRLPPPVKYPAEVYKMSDADFFAWATDFNKRERAALEERRAKITEKEWIEGRESDTDSSYADYQYDNYGYGSDYPRGYFTPSVQYGRASQKIVEYPRRWKNPAYVGPGPLTIVNPYCPPSK